VGAQIVVEVVELDELDRGEQLPSSSPTNTMACTVRKPALRKFSPST
jgi:hypothetical protein